MCTIRDLQIVSVEGLPEVLFPLLCDGWQRLAAVHVGPDVGDRLWGPVLRVEDARVREVEVVVGEPGGVAPLAQTVAGFGGHVGEDVGADVVSAEGVEVPVEG